MHADIYLRSLISNNKKTKNTYKHKICYASYNFLDIPKFLRLNAY